MTKEQIEKATDEYIGYAREADEGLGVTMRRSAFMDGAQWRINSVWHKPSAYGEELIKDVEVIVKTEKDYRFGTFDTVGFYNEYLGFVSWAGIEYALSEVLEYAYLSDLLPERKEETE